MPEIKLLTREIVDCADIVYSGRKLPDKPQEIKKIEEIYDDGKVRKVHSNLSNFNFIGIDLDSTPRPYLCVGKPEIKDGWIKNSMRYWGRENDTLKVLNQGNWASQIRENDGYVYFGAHEETTLLMFDTPIPFDPNKEFISLRSNNKKLPLEKIIAKEKLIENIICGKWMTLEENGKTEIKEMFYLDRETKERYDEGKFKSIIEIYEAEERKIISIVKGGRKIFIQEKDGNGKYDMVQLKEMLKEHKNFYLPENTNSFDPLSFDISNYEEIKGKIDSKDILREYSVMYVNPKEILNKKWIYLGDWGKVSRKDNIHIFN